MSVTNDLTSEDQAELSHGFDGFTVGSVRREGTAIGYRVAGEGPAVVLIHGYPQTGYAWREVAVILVSRGYQVIVPDYRGAGVSDKPDGGYDKISMAADMHAVMQDVGVERSHVVGHDLGAMVAYAYARSYASACLSLTIMDGVIPGTPLYQGFLSSLGPWHFGFHSQVDLATTIIGGRERAYFDWLFDAHMVTPAAITDDDRSFYVAAAQKPGGLAAGFRVYAAATTVDITDNQKTLEGEGRLAMPVLGIGGAVSLGPWMDGVLAEIGTDTRSVSVEDSGHFVPEEQPLATADALVVFFAAVTS